MDRARLTSRQKGNQPWGCTNHPHEFGYSPYTVVVPGAGHRKQVLACNRVCGVYRSQSATARSVLASRSWIRQTPRVHSPLDLTASRGPPQVAPPPASESCSHRVLATSDWARILRNSVAISSMANAGSHSKYRKVESERALVTVVHAASIALVCGCPRFAHDLPFVRRFVGVHYLRKVRFLRFTLRRYRFGLSL